MRFLTLRKRRRGSDRVMSDREQCVPRRPGFRKWPEHWGSPVIAALEDAETCWVSRIDGMICVQEARQAAAEALGCDPEEIELTSVHVKNDPAMAAEHGSSDWWRDCHHNEADAKPAWRCAMVDNEIGTEAPPPSPVGSEPVSGGGSVTVSRETLKWAEGWANFAAGDPDYRWMNVDAKALAEIRAAPPEIDWERVARSSVHPLRLRILQLIFARGESSATELAALLDEGVPNTSYHVRILAKHGLLVEARVERVRGTLAHFYKLREGLAN